MFLAKLADSLFPWSKVTQQAKLVARFVRLLLGAYGIGNPVPSQGYSSASAFRFSLQISLLL
jgi:hypothetical protein